MKYLYTFLAIVLTVSLQAQNTIATYDLNTVADTNNPFFLIGGNTAEQGNSYVHDDTEGAWILGGLNLSADNGAAYIGFTNNIAINSASETLTVEFDVKAKTALTGAALHLDIYTPTATGGKVSKSNVQNDFTITTTDYTTVSYDVPVVAGIGYVKLEFNVATSPGINNGGELYIDNVVFKNATSHPSQIQVTINPLNTWTGFLQTFDHVAQEPNYDAFQFESAWGLGDLTANVDSNNNTIELVPNTNLYNGADTYWSDGAGDGNKWVVCTTKVEYNPANATAFVTGSEIAFAGNVTSTDLDTRYALKAFVKTLDPADNYATVENDEHVITTTGGFELIITPGAGHIVQYGFEMQGMNANPSTDWGSATVGQGTFAFDKVVSDFELSIYPNPASRIANISSAESIDLVRIFDLTGRVVKQATPNKSNFSLDVADLSKGVYIVKLNAGDKEAMTKLIK